MGRASTVYELSFNQTRDVAVKLTELQAVVYLVPTSGLEAA